MFIVDGQGRPVDSKEKDPPRVRGARFDPWTPLLGDDQPPPHEVRMTPRWGSGGLKPKSGVREII